MNSLEFRNKLHLPSIINVSDSKIDKIISEIDKYYSEWEEIKMYKSTYQPKTYKDGTIKKRIIRPSKGILKIIQSRIKDQILANIELPNEIHGGRKQRSNITNAKPHQGKKYTLTTDLQDFFPSIKVKRIHDTFTNLGFNKQSTFYLTRLTTWKGELPQGTPTSTHLSNIIFLETDYKLISFCKEHDITYTRFIDDLTFSSQKDFQHLIEPILTIILQSGLRISRRKTYYKKNQTITGINVFLNKIDASENILLKVKEEENLPDDCPKPYTTYRSNIKKTNKKSKSNP